MSAQFVSYLRESNIRRSDSKAVTRSPRMKDPACGALPSSVKYTCRRDIGGFIGSTVGNSVGTKGVFYGSGDGKVAVLSFLSA